MTKIDVCCFLVCLAACSWTVTNTAAAADAEKSKAAPAKVKATVLTPAAATKPAQIPAAKPPQVPAAKPPQAPTSKPQVPAAQIAPAKGLPNQAAVNATVSADKRPKQASSVNLPTATNANATNANATSANASKANPTKAAPTAPLSMDKQPKPLNASAAAEKTKPAGAERTKPAKPELSNSAPSTKEKTGKPTAQDKSKTNQTAGVGRAADAGATPALPGQERTKAQSKSLKKEKGETRKTAHRPGMGLVPPPPPDTPTILAEPGGMFQSIVAAESPASLTQHKKDLINQLASANKLLDAKTQHEADSKSKAEQFKSLFTEGVISKRELESAQTEAESSVTEVNDVKLKVTSLQNMITRIDERLAPKPPTGKAHAIASKNQKSKKIAQTKQAKKNLSVSQEEKKGGTQASAASLAR